MQEGGIILSFNKAEIKRRLRLKEFSIQLFNVSKSVIYMSNENTAIPCNFQMHKVNFDNVSELIEDPSNDYSKFPIKPKKKRVIHRVLKVNSLSRRKMRRFGNARKQKKLNQLIEESVVDENTTNSENSESNNLYSEINWEEYLDCESSALVDEFAPRVQVPVPGSSKSVDAESAADCGPTQSGSIAADSGPSQSSSIAADKSVMEDNEYAPGATMYVKDFHTSEWKSVRIVEVDWDDNELLVHYEDKSKCDEWFSMNSGRISMSMPSVPSVEKEIIIEDYASHEPPVESSDDEMETESVVEEEVAPTKDVRKIRQRNWKKNRSNLSYTSIKSYGVSKFVIGEKVLAKWSDHRMQKFPAVIKTIVGDGRYDVLFYDGFEKTISEDHLYKTTEEEVAKYQRTNPSEADIFVDMDANSKEARRQRKKKTFDDYVFNRDVKMTRKKGFKPVEGIVMKNKLNFYNKSSDKEIGVPKPILNTGKKIRRRRRALYSPRRTDPYKMKMYHNTERNTESKSGSFTVSEKQNLQSSSELTTVYKNDAEDLAIKEQIDDRWNVDIPSGCSAFAMTRDDGTELRSVIVPDKNLPIGWSKHAIPKGENVWNIILVSPDGHKFTHLEKLRRYFTDVLGEDLPTSLDFLADYSILPELSARQKNLPVVEKPKIWFRTKWTTSRKRRGKGKSITGVIKSSAGKVRTLLPKYRMEASPAITPGPDSEVWKCVKEGCDKKFRKENMLQMHIKHYHTELSSRSAPSMVDIACKRSESANSDSSKLPLQTIKRILPRTFSGSSSNINIDKDIIDSPEQPSPSFQSIRNRERAEMTSAKRPSTVEERRTTIKTILPIRQADTPLKGSIHTDDNESEDDYIEQKKNGSRIFKPGRFRRGKVSSVARGDEMEIGHTQSPTFKFTKKKSLDKLQIATDSNDSYTEEEKISPNTEVTDDGIVIERLRSEEFINCTCGFREEDGLMIQCDICMCWQHGLCSGIETESDVPERYTCGICKNPYRVRSSKKYSYAQHYLTQGKLPSFNFRARNEETINEREMMLKRCFEISSSIHEIKNVERSLSAKLNIAEQSDHPKLYLWAKNWDQPHVKSEFKRENFTDNRDNYETAVRLPSGPQPEAPIDLEECRIRLLDSVENTFSQLENRLTSVQAQIAALESQDPVCNSVPDKVMKQTIQMLIRDVETIQKFAAIS